MKNRKLLSMLTGLGAATYVVAAFAFAPIGGRVITVVGAADILRAQASIPAEKGAVLQSGDLLSTPFDGQLQWWMEDDSMLSMASSSQMRIQQFEPKSAKASYALESGAVRIVSGTIHPTVLTPVATVDALGTDFSSFICGAACKADSKGGQQTGPSLYVRVGEGRVRVHNPAGSIEATKGQIVYVGSVTEAPKLVSTAPSIFIDVSSQLEFAVGTSDFVPDLPIQPIQPIPPEEQPGSPS